jgi:Na+(H+)/acetate symporter ActP
MRFFGLEISRAKASAPANSSPPDSSRGWVSLSRDWFTGAWQSNVEIRSDLVMAQATVFACMTLIANDIAKMRLRLMQKEGQVWAETESAAFSPVLRKPNRYQKVFFSVEDHAHEYRADPGIIGDDEWAWCQEQGFTRRDCAAWWLRVALPYVVAGLVAAGGLAAALSTADGLLLAIANALSHDIYYRMVDPNASTQRRLVVARARRRCAPIGSGWPSRPVWKPCASHASG